MKNRNKGKTGTNNIAVRAPSPSTSAPSSPSSPSSSPQSAPSYDDDNFDDNGNAPYTAPTYAPESSPGGSPQYYDDDALLTLPAEYYQRNQPIINQQLAMAGVRLAKLLNDVLGGDSPNDDDGDLNNDDVDSSTYELKVKQQMKIINEFQRRMGKGSK